MSINDFRTNFGQVMLDHCSATILHLTVQVSNPLLPINVLGNYSAQYLAEPIYHTLTVSLLSSNVKFPILDSLLEDCGQLGQVVQLVDISCPNKRFKSTFIIILSDMERFNYNLKNLSWIKFSKEFETDLEETIAD